MFKLNFVTLNYEDMGNILYWYVSHSYAEFFEHIVGSLFTSDTHLSRKFLKDINKSLY